jgi:transposase
LPRASKRKRDTDGEYEQAVKRAGRLGLSHREIAAVAEVSHGTVRAILARATASANGADLPLLTADAGGVDGETT